VDLNQMPEFRLKLQRTNDGFITAWSPVGGDEWVSKSVPRADLISVQIVAGKIDFFHSGCSVLLCN
jgi:pectate disaccharide-lyase